MTLTKEQRIQANHRQYLKRMATNPQAVRDASRKYYNAHREQVVDRHTKRYRFIKEFKRLANIDI